MVLLKNIGKALVPEPVWAELRRRYKAPKTYWTWAGAQRAAGTYDNDVLNRFRVERRPPAVDPLPDDHPLAAALQPFPATAAPAIVDLGGSTGELMRAALHRWPRASCTVVETPGLVALLRHYSDVTVVTKPPQKCDVFYIGGTLQYLPQPYQMLAQAFAGTTHSVVLTRNCFSPRSIIRVQSCHLFENGTGPIPPHFEDRLISYPHRTISESRVLAIARKAGFALAHERPDSTGVQPYLDRVYGKTMIFQRSKP